jgi:hypothetical protein
MPGISKYRDMILAGDSEGLAAIVSERFGVPIAAVEFLEECRQAIRSVERISGCRLGVGKESDWSDSTWFMWLKKRVEALDCYRVVNPDDRANDWGSVTLHVGFIFIEETPEQLAELRRRKEPIKAGEPARSKIGSTGEIITPIDRVAARVLPVGESD